MSAENRYAKIFGSEDRLLLEFEDRVKHPVYAWPRTLISYPIRFETQVGADELCLKNLVTGEPVPFQLSEVETRDGRLCSARLNFFSDLPSGDVRRYELRKGLDRKISPAHPVKQFIYDDAIEIDGGKISVRIPVSATAETDAGPAGPIIGINRGTGWIGESRIVSPGRRITGLEVDPVDVGELFISYRMTYHFDGGGVYVATVRVISDYEFIEFYESMTGLQEKDHIRMEMVWTGFHPNRRFGTHSRLFSMDHWAGIDEPLLDAYVEEDPHWSPGWREAPGKEMVVRLSPYGGNGIREIPPMISFWDDQAGGGDELGVFVLDHCRWQDYRYMIWQPSTLLQLRFRFSEGMLHWVWPLVEGMRVTAINYHDAQAGEADVERLRATLRPIEEKGMTSDASRFRVQHMRLRYNQLLHQWYAALCLDRVKDWALGYSKEAAIPESIFEDGLTQSADELEDMLFRSSFIFYPLGLNFWPGINAIQHRFVYAWAVDGFMRFRQTMPEAQRKRIEALLLLGAYVTAGEELSPIRTCMAGCPNMSADGWSVPMQMAFLFPGHPMAEEWRNQYEKYAELTALFYTRPDVPVYESKGGRWTESLGVYTWAFMRPTGCSQFAGVLTDGKNRWANRWMALKGRWLVDALTAPIYNPDPYWRQNADPMNALPYALPSEWQPGMPLSKEYGFERQYPAHGAHGSGTAVRQKIDVWTLGHQMLRYRPLVAEHLLWCSHGLDLSAVEKNKRHADWDTPRKAYYPENCGTNPHLKSCKYTGHGIVLRAGVDTPEELSIHIEQIDRGPNYRWGNSGEGASGSLYFFAGGRMYTGHERESSGDRNLNDTDGVTTFGVMKDGEFCSVGMHLLERPLYDLGVAQFAEVVPRQGDSAYSWPEYQGRSVMLVGTDYFILYDRSRGASRFSWFTARDQAFPRFFFLKPMRIRQDHWTELTTPMSVGFHRDHPGSSMALVTHKDEIRMPGLSGQALLFPERVNLQEFRRRPDNDLPEGVFDVETASRKDRIFRDERPIDFCRDGYCFRGTVGVVRQRKADSDSDRIELALFQGTVIGYGGLVLTSDNEELGISAVFEDASEVMGEYFCRADSRVRFTTGGRTADAPGIAKLYVDGAVVETERLKDGFAAILPAGQHKWERTKRMPEPVPPPILRTESRSGGARVVFTPVAGAESYRIELSRDGGLSFSPVAETAAGEMDVLGLADETKVHVRVVALNSERESPPGDEYPVYVTRKPPLPPDGLWLRLERDAVHLAWGDVLGVTAYRLYRRRQGENDYEKVYEGLDTTYCDAGVVGVVPPFELPGLAANAARDMSAVMVYEYTVAAVSHNGEGNKSPIATTDPRNWRNWYPERQALKFKRQTAYWLPPYVNEKMSPPEYYPE